MHRLRSRRRGCARAESGGKKVSRSTISGSDSISWTHSLKKQLEISLHISVHLCVCVCLCVPVCGVYVRVCVQKCQWAIRQLVVCAVGHLRASQPTHPPHPVRVTECSAMMCPLAKPTTPLFSLCVAPSLFLCIRYTMYIYLHLCYYLVITL